MNFLDVTVTRNPSQTTTLYTKIYEKELNLHLYIPPQSANPPGVLKGMIYGMINRFYILNTKEKDFLQTTKNFFKYLIARGYKHDDIKPIFLQATTNATKTKRVLTEEEKKAIEKFSKNQLFLHFVYHPKDVSRQKIQQTQRKESCLPDEKDAFRLDYLFTLSKVTVAYCRPRNLRNYIFPSTLYQEPGNEVSVIVRNHINNNK